MNEDISIPARRFLRAWALSTDLAGLPPIDPRVQRILGIAPPSTPEQNELECHFVAALTAGDSARTASTPEVADQMLAVGAPHLRALDAAGERDAAKEAIAVINSTRTVQALMHRIGGDAVTSDPDMALVPLTVAAGKLSPRAAAMALYALPVAGVLPERWERTLRACLGSLAFNAEPLGHEATTGIDASFAHPGGLPDWMSFDPAYAAARAFTLDVYLASEQAKAQAAKRP